jgi:hypothetical protein
LAHGMPHRPCVISAACGSTRQDIRSRPRSPSWCPLSGDWGLVTKVRSLPSARGPGTSVEVAAAPGAWRGVGKCARGNAGPIVSGESASAVRLQSNDADPLSVGFSTLSTRMWAACPRRNTGDRQVGPAVKCAALRSRNSAATAGVSLQREDTALCPLTRPRP